MKFRIEIVSDDEEVVAKVHSASALTDGIERLCAEYDGVCRLYLYSPERDLYIFADYSELERITIEDGKTAVYDSSGNRYLSKLRLYEMEENLPSCFLKVSKSALVNRDHIVRFQTQFTGSVDVLLGSGCTEQVSRRCLAEIKRRMRI